uniref:Secreted protein n=1 Tax=Syphacia muris TaxID=451379 RepID=A0A0N5AKY7_9BILA
MMILQHNEQMEFAAIAAAAAVAVVYIDLRQSFGLCSLVNIRARLALLAACLPLCPSVCLTGCVFLCA